MMMVWCWMNKIKNFGDINVYPDDIMLDEFSFGLHDVLKKLMFERWHLR